MAPITPPRRAHSLARRDFVKASSGPIWPGDLPLLCELLTEGEYAELLRSDEGWRTGHESATRVEVPEESPRRQCRRGFFEAVKLLRVLLC